MKQQLYLLIAIFISLFSFGQTLDQSSVSSSGIDSGANAANPQGQSFTAGVTGDLSQINLRLGDTGAFTPGDFQLTIYNGNGYAGAVLNTTTLNISSTSSGLTEEYAIVLSSPVSITAGNMYTFDFRGLGSASINFRANFGGYGPGGYYFGSGNPGLYNTYDIWFKTFVSPPASPATHLNFDGVNDRVELANESNFDFTTSFSIEAWVRVTSFTEEWQTVISKGEQGPRIHRFGSTNLIAFGTGPGDDLASTVSVNDGNWHHIAVTCNNGFKSLYVDGVLQGTQTVSTPLATNNDNVRIGSQIDSYIPVRAFHGDIDDVRFWNVARSNVEINNSKDCELNGSETGLVAYYNFNQGNDGSNNSTETTLSDTSSNGNNGTLNNFTLNSATSNWLAGSIVTTGNNCATLSNNDFAINDDNILTVYPNPSNGVFSITSQQESLVTVYDMIGKKVLSTKVSIGSSNLDLSNYANGIYLLTVTNQSGGLKTFKLIKR
ncbi:LamG-like jellyroll fold domain-containing protein [Flavobacterium okayamense]|uniref:LamG-like jellyroll fold domain-containing protein n=1 Tax=Flavobacterium okayamense TaxID=2830782 RepID=A0ABM7S8E2_9FLAO|nr:LamG-like jellyroll fold domain-containing protein [Flavobacterium okayamense]BCY27615.1 hypothetical protein KK2020170_04830 [Flavobacterium okayamense]